MFTLYISVGFFWADAVFLAWGVEHVADTLGPAVCGTTSFVSIESICDCGVGGEVLTSGAIGAEADIMPRRSSGELSLARVSFESVGPGVEISPGLGLPVIPFFALGRRSPGTVVSTSVEADFLFKDAKATKLGIATSVFNTRCTRLPAAHFPVSR